MPNLIGAQLRKAESTVLQIQPNARLSEQEGEYTNSYGPGVVVNQSPQAGAFLKPGVQVILYCNPKPPPVYSRMPNLIGLDGKAAVSKLSSDAPGLQWKVQQAEAYIPNYRVGAVVSQSPVAETELRPGVSAAIYLNPQPTVRRMPKVVGLNEGSATQTLRQETPDIPYQFEIAPRNNPNYVEGIVVSQHPAAGTELGQGIKIVMSLNPRPAAAPPPGARTLVAVPDVRKKELTEAIGLLREAQLNVGAVTKKDPKETANSVLEQQPLPGQQVAVASRIDLVIGGQPETGGLIKDALKILGVIALGFFAFLTGRLWRRFGSKPGEGRANSDTLKIPHDDKPPPAPTLTFRSIMNTSSSEFAASTELQTSFALRFQPRADWGRQYISHTGGLTAAESEEL